MKESATLSLEFLKSNSELYGIDNSLFQETNVHIHVPEGATPKDGPSAGITMFTSLVSLFTTFFSKSVRFFHQSENTGFNRFKHLFKFFNIYN